MTCAFMPEATRCCFTSDDKREFQSLAQMDLASKRVDVLDDINGMLAASKFPTMAACFAYTLNRDGFSDLFVRG